jgi:uncharacterized membrane protein YfcA
LTLAQALPLVGVSVIAGILNSIAGGGTLLTFPALLAAGIGPLAANATNTVALVPGSAAAAWGYALELAGRRRVVLALCLPSLVGGVIGALLTRRAGDRLFGQLVPWLILTATLLFVAQEPLARYLFRGRVASPPGRPLRERRHHLVGVAGFQLLVAIYGGFFGAGMGILILAALAGLGFADVHEMNALKNVVVVCINGTATLTFIALGLVVWPIAGLMAVGAISGGYGGARLARRLSQRGARLVITLIGFGIAAFLFTRRI